MKLSEAIRLGAMNRPQAFGVFYERETDATCATGSALDACGRLNKDDTTDGRQNIALRELFPILLDVPTRCPTCREVFADDDKLNNGLRLIWHLNDSHKLTRQQIADWVESVEQQHSAAPAIEAVEQLR